MCEKASNSMNIEHFNFDRIELISSDALQHERKKPDANALNCLQRSLLNLDNMNENVICACRQQCQQHSRSNKANLDVSNAMAPLNTSSIDLKRVSTPQNGLSLLRFEPVVLENINSMFGRENAIRKRHRSDNSNCSYIPK